MTSEAAHYYQGYSPPITEESSLMPWWPSSSAYTIGWWLRHTDACLAALLLRKMAVGSLETHQVQNKGCVDLLLPTNSERGKQVFHLKREADLCFQPIQLRCQIPCGQQRTWKASWIFAGEASSSLAGAISFLHLEHCLVLMAQVHTCLKKCLGDPPLNGCRESMKHWPPL